MFSAESMAFFEERVSTGASMTSGIVKFWNERCACSRVIDAVEAGFEKEAVSAKRKSAASGRKKRNSGRMLGDRQGLDPMGSGRRIGSRQETE